MNRQNEMGSLGDVILGTYLGRGRWKVDQERFDRMVRNLANGSSRRAAVKGAVAGVGAALVGLLGRDAGAQTVGTFDATCRGTNDSCQKPTQCCSRRCDGGQCICRRKGSACSADRACCSGKCRQGKCTAGEFTS